MPPCPILAPPRSGTSSSWAATGWKQTIGALLPDRLLFPRATDLSPRDMTGRRSAAIFGWWLRPTPTLPTREDLALGEIFYDTPHFNSGPFTIGFRNRDDRRWDGPFGAFEGAGVALDVPIGCRSNLLVSCHERSRMSVLQTRPSRNRRTDRATQRATRASDRISSCGRAS
jgi:hypothetical protein